MRRHYQSNELGEREFVRYEVDEDEAYERLRDSIEIQNAIDRVQSLQRFAPKSDGFTDQRDEEAADQEYCDRAVAPRAGVA